MINVDDRKKKKKKKEKKEKKRKQKKKKEKKKQKKSSVSFFKTFSIKNMSGNTFHPRLEVFFCVTDNKNYAEKAIQRMQAQAMITGMTTKSAEKSQFTYYIAAGVWINRIDPHQIQVSYMMDLSDESELPNLPFDIDMELRRSILSNLRWSLNTPSHLINGPRTITPQEVRGAVDFLIIGNDNDGLDWRQFSVQLIVNGSY